jgi:hypothetical protein
LKASGEVDFSFAESSALVIRQCVPDRIHHIPDIVRKLLVNDFGKQHQPLGGEVEGEP